jgi:hypothetical protein
MLVQSVGFVGPAMAGSRCTRIDRAESAQGGYWNCCHRLFHLTRAARCLVRVYPKWTHGREQLWSQQK